jgi:hypothetical protein
MTKKIHAGLWSGLQPPLQRRTRLPVEALPLRKNHRDKKLRSGVGLRSFPLVDLSVEEGRLTLHVRGADKLWAFKSALEISLVHIACIRAAQRSQAAFFAVVLRRCLDFDSQKSTGRTTEPPSNPLVRMLPVPSHGSCIGSRPVHCPQPETELLSVALMGWACVS